MIGHRLARGRAIDDHDAFEVTHLRCGDADRGRAIDPRLLQVSDERAQRVVELGYRRRFLLQCRFGQGQDFRIATP